MLFIRDTVREEETNGRAKGPHGKRNRKCYRAATVQIKTQLKKKLFHPLLVPLGNLKCIPNETHVDPG